MHKIYFFFQKKIYVCLPYLNFSDILPETHLFFYLALPVTKILTVTDEYPRWNLTFSYSQTVLTLWYVDGLPV